MSESKHTPGPWVAGDTHFQRDFRIFVNVTGGKDHFVACVSADPMQRDAIAANARLIAAAPDLLDALKAVVSLKGWDEREPVSATGRQVLAVLAKAEGRDNGKA